MTVQELIELLKRMPQNAVVVTCDAEWGYGLVSNPVVEKNVTIQHYFSDKPDTKIEVAVVL